jgi:O-antigen ligase
MINIINSFILIGGVISIFSPILLIYLFSIIPITQMTYSASEVELVLRLIRIGSLNLFATDYLLLILLILLVFEAIKISKIKTFSAFIAGPINKIIFIMFAWEVIIGILSYQKGLSLQNVLRQLSNEALMFISVFIPQLKDIDFKKEYFYKYIAILGGIVIVFSGLWRYFITHEVNFTSSGTSRAISGSAVIFFIIPICYILFHRNFLYEKKFFSYTIIAFMVIGIFLAGHRSGFIVLIFIFGMWYLKSEYPKLDYMFIPLWAGTLFVIAFFIISTTHITAGKSFLGDAALRLKDTFDMENKTTVGRLDVWQYCIDMAKEKPLIGVGSFPVYSAIEGDEGQSSQMSLTGLELPPHNLFVGKLIHEGIIGMSIVMIFFYVVYKQVRIISITNKSNGDFYMAYILGFLIFSFFNTTFTNPVGKTYLFTILGFINTESLKMNISNRL